MLGRLENAGYLFNKIMRCQLIDITHISEVLEI